MTDAVADPPTPARAARPGRGTPPDPLAVDANGVAALLSLGLRTVRQMDAAGRLPRPVRLGGRVLWRVPELRAWLDAGAPDRAAWDAIRTAARRR